MWVGGGVEVDGCVGGCGWVMGVVREVERLAGEGGPHPTPRPHPTPIRARAVQVAPAKKAPPPALKKGQKTMAAFFGRG